MDGGVGYRLRDPCKHCGQSVGSIELKGGQDCVYCRCGRFQYNAPKTETGRRERTVATTHKGIKPNLRYKVIDRAKRHCETCLRHQDSLRDAGGLHVGHRVSVADATAMGWTDRQINHMDNLIAQCGECNLGLGKVSLSSDMNQEIDQLRKHDGR